MKRHIQCCLFLQLAVVLLSDATGTLQNVRVETSADQCSKTINLSHNTSINLHLYSEVCERCQGFLDCPLTLLKKCRIRFTIADEMEKALLQICFQSHSFTVTDCLEKVTFEERTPSGTLNHLNRQEIGCSRRSYSREICLDYGSGLNIVFSGYNFCSVKGYGVVKSKSAHHISLSSNDSCPSGSRHIDVHRASGTISSYYGTKDHAPAVFCNATLSSSYSGRRMDFCFSFRYASFQPGGATLQIYDQSGNNRRKYGYDKTPSRNSEYCILLGKPNKVKVFIQTACSRTSECAAHNYQHAFVFSYKFKENLEAEATSFSEGEDDNWRMVSAAGAILFIILPCCCCMCWCCTRKDASESTNGTGTAAAAESQATGNPRGETRAPVFVHPTQSISSNSQGQARYQTTDMSAPPPAWSTIYGRSSRSHPPSSSAVPASNGYPSPPPIEESRPFVDHNRQDDDSDLPPAYNSLFPDSM
ncbi:uncharacterized protein LOC101859705 isoform X2 [Aplysia californica]|uniref:Uncharacterized protein LOC101859705 isoform X2 n=1 Tax=Aplysia californica TaxID=6500 RepID=A0ABM1A000_APLCA|nr:uncharacterized protein LOC101859705 isoform X2 [Aplysia californica]